VLAEFLKRFIKQSDSKTIAKDRLQFVLVHDRANITPDTLDALKLDLIEVVSKYFDVDREALGIEVQRHKTTSALVVNLPFRRSKVGKER
jgi:cell division topological specificity factor